MTYSLQSLILIIALLANSALAGTQKEIAHLLDFVAQTPCQYDRNGTIHTGQEARAHINMKYEYYKQRVKTAEDFIKYSATKSKISGKKYRIHCPDTGTMDASDWLLQELDRYRSSLEP